MVWGAPPLAEQERLAQEALEDDARMSPAPWRTGSGYEQSERGNFVSSEATGAIVCAEQDDTNCVLSTEDRDGIARARAREPVLARAVRALIAERRQAAQLVRGLKREHHYCDEDPHYSCPRHPRLLPDDDCEPAACICGADEHNASVEEVAREMEGA